MCSSGLIVLSVLRERPVNWANLINSIRLAMLVNAVLELASWTAKTTYGPDTTLWIRCRWFWVFQGTLICRKWRYI